MMITSIHNKTIKELMKLKQKKYRQQYYLVESMHLVEEAVRTHQADLVISTAPVDMGVENLLVSKEVMAKLAFTKTPQPIMARCRIQKNNEQKAILDKIDNNFFGRAAVKLYHLYQKIFRK